MSAETRFLRVMTALFQDGGEQGLDSPAVRAALELNEAEQREQDARWEAEKRVWRIRNKWTRETIIDAAIEGRITKDQRDEYLAAMDR